MCRWVWTMVLVMLTACANNALVVSMASQPIPVRLPSTPSPKSQAKFVINLRDAPPTVTLVSSSAPIDWKIEKRKLPGTPGSSDKLVAPVSQRARPQPGEWVDNWELMLGDDFESVFPIPACAVTPNNAWGPNTERAWSGKQSLASAPGQANWLVCGPFEATNAHDLLLQFVLSQNLADTGDFWSWGVSTNGQDFDFVRLGATDWARYDVWVTPNNQSRVWFAFVASKNVWLDDLRIWRYNTPAIMCGGRDPGKKGIHVPSHESSNNVWLPIMRGDDTTVLTGLIDAHANWVRLGMRLPDPSSPYTVEQEFDRMVDSLCAAGISVLGMVNHETLATPLSDSPSYRQEFARNVWWYATHFKDRIAYWELWNEPNLPTLHISPASYAALLAESYRAIGAANANAKLVFGGLGSGWNDSNDYFDQVHFYLNRDQGGARPFDVFALHLYFGDKYALDPAMYLHAPDQMDIRQGDRTIVDKFVRTMQKYGDVSRKIWVTEIGWNSAKYEKGAPVLVVDQPTQALYLKKSFDILFNEAPMIDKIFWYQYHDVNTPDRVPGFWGLYGIDKRTPKPALCAFAAYPKACGEK